MNNHLGPRNACHTCLTWAAQKAVKHSLRCVTGDASSRAWQCQQRTHPPWYSVHEAEQSPQEEELVLMVAPEAFKNLGVEDTLSMIILKFEVG